MVDRIQDHIYDLLAADARLLNGGFASVQRVYNGDAEVGGQINLFDWALEDDSKEARPGVYFGLRNAQASDRLESTVVSNMGLVQQRIAVIPIAIVCEVPSRKDAKNQRRQIAANVRAILTDSANVVQDNYWWLLRELSSTFRFRNSGGGNLGTIESTVVISFEASYAYIAGQVTV